MIFMRHKARISTQNAKATLLISELFFMIFDFSKRFSEKMKEIEGRKGKYSVNFFEVRKELNIFKCTNKS